MLTTALDKDIDPVFGVDRAGDIKHSHANINRARELLGYSPKYDFKRGIDDAITWYQANLLSGGKA